jgi:HEAT repeat protein
MTKRRWFWLGTGLVIGLGVAWLVPTSRLVLGGLIHNESTYRGKPTRYWARALAESEASFAETVELLKRQPSTAVPMLVEILGDPDPLARRRASLALGSLGQPAVPALCEALHHPDPLVRIAAARALQRVGPEAEAAIPALTKAMRDDDPLAARMAITALACIGKNAVPILHDALRDPEEAAIHGAILEALGRIGSAADETTPTLVAIFKDPNSPVQEEAAAALRKINPQAAEAAGAP